MRGIARRAFGTALVALAGAVALTSPGTAREDVLTYSIREARAYAFRVPLRDEVIRAARRAQPCDPQEDPYRCDDTRYEHEPNCPPAIAVGRTGRGPGPADPKSNAESGRAGAEVGPRDEPPLGSPVTLNDLVTFGRLGRTGSLLDASGFASESYVDLSGRQEPAAHTESDAFSVSRRSYEERCFGEISDGSYVHVLSRSTDAPSTYHLAECFERGCRFGGPAAGGAEEGRTIVRLTERDGAVVAEASALLERATWADGAFSVESVRSAIRIESNGTPGALRWKVATSVTGARLGGRPIELAPGQGVALPGFQIGLAEPFVETSDDGKRIRVVAPGLYFATERQSAFFGGTELSGTFGRSPPLPDDHGEVDDGSDDPFGTGFGDDFDVPDTGTIAPIPTPSVTPAVPGANTVAGERAVEIQRVRTGQGALVALLSLALFALLLVLVRWIGRFAWGRRLYRIQPFRAVDWLYRAFVKT